MRCFAKGLGSFAKSLGYLYNTMKCLLSVLERVLKQLAGEMDAQWGQVLANA